MNLLRVSLVVGLLACGGAGLWGDASLHRPSPQAGARAAHSPGAAIQAAPSRPLTPPRAGEDRRSGRAAPQVPPTAPPVATLRWVEPTALDRGLAALLPDNRAVSLVVGVSGPGGADVDPTLGRFTWRLASGRGRLIPFNDGTECRFLPEAGSAEATVVEVRFSLAEAPQRGRLIPPVSAEHLDAEGRLFGFELGHWPDPQDAAHLRALGGYEWVRLHPAAYRPPQWFYPVTRANKEWPISRHVRLGDFAMDHPWFSLGMPQWVAIDPLLVAKLEDLADLLHGAGIAFERFTFIYGFRSPAYNLGRIERDQDETLKSPFSMHMYGRAADILIDTDGDLRLDDLDRDGQITVRDAAVLMHYVNELDRRYRAQGDPRVGGAGLYDHHDFFERPVQSPYVHVDVRGYLAEDGTLIRWPARWPDSGEPIRWGQL